MSKKTHRVQVDFSEDAYNLLLKLKENAGAENVSTVIKDALGLYNFWINEKNTGEGAELFVRKNGEEDLVLIAANDDQYETKTSDNSQLN